MRSTRSTEARALGVRGALAAAALTAVAGAAAGQPAERSGADHGTHVAPAAASRYVRSQARYRVPAVTLVDMEGDEVELPAALERDGPVLVQFIFTTCPGVCPALSALFSAAQDRLAGDGDGDGRGARLLSISIDPEHDTPERLREYARRFGAGPRWGFLTGAVDDVAAVQKAFDSYRGNKMEHRPTTFVRVAAGDAWTRLDGFLTAGELVAEVERLLARGPVR